MTDIHLTPKWSEVKPDGCYVYIHRKLSDGAIFYVGKAKGQRGYTKSGRSVYWVRVAEKHDVTVEVCQEGLSEERAFLLETWLIAKFRHEGKALVNLTDGGEGASGIPAHPNRIKAVQERFSKPVYCSNGIKYKGCSDAARAIGTKGKNGGSHISSCASGRSPSAYGFGWSYEGFPDHPDPRYERTSITNGAPVINSDGKVFQTARLAAEWLREELGVNTIPAFIAKAARQGSTAYGFTWSRNIDRCPEYIDPNYTNVKNSMKPVLRSDGAEFESISCAVRELKECGHPKARSSGIHAALIGKCKTAYGYKWKYSVDTL